MMNLSHQIMYKVNIYGSYIFPRKFSKMLFNQWFITERKDFRKKEIKIKNEAACSNHIIDNANNITVYEWGNGPIIAISHGWNGRACEFYNIIEKLTSSGYRVIAFDYPGHGESTGSETNLVEMSKVLNTFLSHYGQVETLICHSLSSLCVLQLKKISTSLKNIILISPPFSLSDVIDEYCKKMPYSLRTKQHFKTHFNDRFGDSVWNDYTFESPKEIFESPIKITIIHDIHDEEVCYDKSRDIIEINPQIRLISTENLGHYKITRSIRTIKHIERIISSSL